MEVAKVISYENGGSDSRSEMSSFGAALLVNF